MRRVLWEGWRVPGASADVTRLHADQTALRRMADLVALDRTTAEVFEAIVVEAAALPGIGFAALLRFDDDGFATVVAADGTPQEVAVGTRRPRRPPAAGIAAPAV